METAPGRYCGMRGRCRAGCITEQTPRLAVWPFNTCRACVGLCTNLRLIGMGAWQVSVSWWLLGCRWRAADQRCWATGAAACTQCSAGSYSDAAGAWRGAAGAVGEEGMSVGDGEGVRDGEVCVCGWVDGCLCRW